MSDFFCLAPSVAFDEKLQYNPGALVETRLCDVDPTHAAEQRWIRPLHVQGPVVPYTEFEWTVYGDLIVSTETARTLCGLGFTGALFLDVEFFGTSETPFGRDSLELRASGWGGMVSKESGIHLINECRFCGNQTFSGYTKRESLIDVDSWDGSDFFVVWPLRRYIMITEAVAEHIIEAKYSGMKIKRLDQLPKVVVGGGFGPGSLKSWRDEIRSLSPLNKKLC